MDCPNWTEPTHPDCRYGRPCSSSWNGAPKRAREVAAKVHALRYPESFERVCQNRQPSDNNYRARLLSVSATLYLKGK